MCIILCSITTKIDIDLIIINIIIEKEVTSKSLANKQMIMFNDNFFDKITPSKKVYDGCYTKLKE